MFWESESHSGTVQPKPSCRADSQARARPLSLFLEELEPPQGPCCPQSWCLIS